LQQSADVAYAGTGASFPGDQELVDPCGEKYKIFLENELRGIGRLAAFQVQAILCFPQSSRSGLFWGRPPCPFSAMSTRLRRLASIA